MKAKCSNNQSFFDGMDEDEKEIVTYGLKQLPLYAAIYASLLLITCLFHMLWQGIFYMLVYFSIRKYAGGFHAATRFRCYCYSVILVIIALVFMKYAVITDMYCKVMTLGCGLILVSMAPVESINKPLDEIERKVYSKKLYIMLAVWMIVEILIPIKAVQFAILISMIQLFFMCTVGMINIGIQRNKI